MLRSTKNLKSARDWNILEEDITSLMHTPQQSIICHKLAIQLINTDTDHTDISCLTLKSVSRLQLNLTKSITL